MIQKFSERFDQLSTEIESIEATKKKFDGYYGVYDSVDDEQLLTWSVKSKNLLIAACGEKSPHYQEFIKAEILSGFEHNYDSFKRMKAVFVAAYEDYKGGYLTSIRSLVQAEVFNDQLDQSRELLKNKYKLAAAVVVGVVLETALKDLCIQNGIAHSKLDKMNADLTKAGIYNLLQQKRITALAEIRNKAAHGNQDAFTDEDVIFMIRDTEQFLSTYLN